MCSPVATAVTCRPIVADGGIDHEDGIDSVQVEKQSVLRPKGQYLGGVPLVAWVQAQKDKNQFAFQGECAAGELQLQTGQRAAAASRATGWGSCRRASAACAAQQRP